ncbi:RNB domain-containing ribonuclease, partial [bacterium]|nr:RNB domain-containing ribonuclease [bacterium]
SHDGVMTSSKFYPCIIKTARRLTYNQVHAFFEEDAQTVKELKSLEKPLTAALALYKKLDKQRQQRGVLDFDLPESKIEVDTTGRPISVKRAPRYESHKLIEEFMIAANRAVARHLKEKNAPSLYRVHETPSTEALQDLNQLLKNMGLSGQVTQVTPRAFAQVLEATAELPAAATVHQAILRLQKQARYMPDPRGHFGLALADYTHFTSPIRRYPDLVVHRSLKGLNGGRSGSDEDYEALGEHTSSMERRATEAERFIVRRKQCWYFLDRVGDFYEGTVNGVTKNGVFVSLGEMAAEGFIPMEFMDGFWEVDERHLCLRRRPGNELLRVGDPIRVQVMKVSVDENQITLGRAEKENE